MNAAETATFFTATKTATIKIKAATLVWEGGAGVASLKVKDLEVSLTTHGHYRSAIKLTYVKAGSRKRTGHVISYHPTLVILEGHVDIVDPMAQETEIDAFDTNTAAALATAIEGQTIAADFRGFDTHCIIRH